MLFPNDKIRIESIKGEYLCSPKLDGIRCLFKDGEMLSRKFKPIPNVQLQKRFEHMKYLSKETNQIYDGELYLHGANYPEIAGYVMSHDKKVPADLQFWCFDMLAQNHPNLNALARFKIVEAILVDLPYVKIVPQEIVTTTDEILWYYSNFRKEGYEGAILKATNSKYKFGRITPKSGDGYKLKPYQTWDVKITGIVQATKCKDGEEYRTVTELGKSKTSKKQEDRVLVEKAAAFVFTFNGFESHASLCMTDEEKEYVWKHPKEFIGKMMEVEGMLVGAKDRIRHPRCIRIREDL